MKAIILIFTLFVACTALYAATWNVALIDSYGDGWTGATLTVMVNGSIVLDAITLDSGSGPDNHPITVFHGDKITTTFVAGTFPGEPEYRFINEAFVTVLSNGAGSAIVPTSITDPFMAAVLTPETHSIGAGISEGILPVYPYYGYSYTQCLYRRWEFPTDLGSRRISNIRYLWNGAASASHSLNWTVYIGHTTRSSFASSMDWVPFAELTQVFQGSVNLLAVYGWVEIVLDRPFEYNGIDNLVVAVDENTPLYDTSAGKFFGINSPGSDRSMIYYSDTYNPDPSAPIFSGERQTYSPSIQFQMDPVLYPPCGESFDLSTIPIAWAQYRSATVSADRWFVSPTSHAAGTANELRCDWVNTTGTLRLISPPVQTAGLSSLELGFKHYFDDYGTGLSAKLQYSHDMNTWLDSGWSFNSGGGDLQGTASVPISGLTGAVTYLAWVLEGNLYYFDRWFLDDVTISVPLIDVAPLRIDTPEVVSSESFIPQATFINYGTSAATFAVTFTIASGFYTNTQIVSGLAPGATQTVDFSPAIGLVNYTTPMRATSHLVTDQVYINDQIGKDLTTLYLDKQVYADIYHYSNPALKGPSTFNLKTPGTLTHLGAPSVTNVFMAGGDWIGNAWFGTEYDTGSLAYDNYYRIDHHTGTQTLLGQTGVPIHGLAWDSNHNILYGTNLASLYILDQATGAATLLGPHVNTPLMIGLAYDSYTDTLYGVDLSTDALYSIDTATGLATQVGLLGIDIVLGQDLAFDREHGYLFLAGYDMVSGACPSLYWINQSSGLAHKIGDFPEDTQVVGFAIPSEPLVLNLRIAANGVLSWDPVPGVTQYMIYGANNPYATTYTHLANTSSTSWLESSFPQPMRFYYVSAEYTRSDAEPRAVRYLTEYKDPLTGEILDPQPVLETVTAKPLPPVFSGEKQRWPGTAINKKNSNSDPEVD